VPTHARIALAALFLAGCDPLSAPTLGYCGNSVVEPELGEACDETSPSCGAPMQTGACQPLCDPSSAEPGCPAHYACGLDGVCRTPSLTFSAPVSFAPNVARQLIPGDYDGDGRDDIVSLSSEVQLRTFGDDLSVTSLFRDPVLEVQSDELGASGQLTGSGRRDLVMPLSAGYWVSFGAVRGVQALRGEPDGTLKAAFVPHRVGLAEDLLLLRRTELGALVVNGDRLELWTALSTPDLGGESVPLPRDASALVSRPAVESRDGCLLVALGFQSEHSVRLYAVDEGGCTLPEVLPVVDAPVSERITGVAWGDIDGDGLSDLIVSSAQSSEPPFAHPAYAWPDGSFASEPSGNPDAAVGRVSSRSLGQAPIAVGDLDRDGVADLVVQEVNGESGWSLYLFNSRQQQSGACTGPVPEGYGCILLAATSLQLLSGDDPQFNQAMIGDVDGDGRADLIVSEATRPTVQIFAGTDPPGLDLVPRVIQTSAPVSRMSLGQADTTDDIADVLLAENTGPDASLAVAYGRLHGTPADPVSLETFSHVADLCPDSTLVLASVDPGEPPMAAIYMGRWPPVVTGVLPGRVTPYTGRFVSNDVDDVALLDVSLDSATAGLALQLLPNRGEAFLGVRNDLSLYPRALLPGAPETCTGNFSICEAQQQSLAVVWDLEGDGVDELILFTDDAGGEGAWINVARATFDGETSGFDFDEPIPLAASIGAGYLPRNRAITVDTTGAGAPDTLLVLTGEESPRLLAFDASLTEPRVLATYEPENAPVAMAALKMGPGEPDTIALLKSTSLDLARVLDVPTTSNPCPTPSEAAPGELVLCSTQELKDAATLATGDFDGDGIGDLAISGSRGQIVMHGEHYNQPPETSNSRSP